MKAHFSFGKSGIDVAVPDGFESKIIMSHTAQALSDERAALDAALDAPIGCEPLLKIAAGKKMPTASSLGRRRVVPLGRGRA